MAETTALDGLKAQLLENGEVAARVAGSLRTIICSPDVTADALEELVSALNTRCFEIEMLRLSLAREGADDLTMTVASQIDHLWHEMMTMARKAQRPRA